VKVLVTGAQGFVGQNLRVPLSRREGVEVLAYDVENTASDLEAFLAEADFIYHLAGVNRPQDPEEFKTGNTGLTTTIVDTLIRLGRTPKIVFTSSIQAEQDNPYGHSKKAAEDELLRYNALGGSVAIYRLRNVFGKWCRPNYNSVTATFCHNIAHDLPIEIRDPAYEVELVYIDDIVHDFLAELETTGDSPFRQVERFTRVSLGRLAELVQSFRACRETLVLPEFEDRFVTELYATYLSYLDGPNFAYDLNAKHDDRGWLAEFIKTPAAGQIFISRTKPGITRGNHFHATKTEKFLVVEGEGVVHFRDLRTGQRVDHPVNGNVPRVVDIPPGWTHSIENTGTGEMVTLFWASEIFDPNRPDTIWEQVGP
jgi:UDP-2-acetamido-2,6-beta-L-arabino-hexul-4-ose reductase